MTDRGKERSRAWLALCAPSALGALLGAVLTNDMMKEGGPVETATAVLLGGLAFGILAFWSRHAIGPRWQVPILSLLLCARELDFDKRFLADGVLKLNLYTDPAPLHHKLIGACVIMLIVIAGYRLVTRDGPVFLAALRARMDWAWWVAGGVVAVVVAKTFDGAARKLEPFGIDLTDGTSRLLGKMEEGMELFFAVALVYTAVLFRRRSRVRCRH